MATDTLTPIMTDTTSPVQDSTTDASPAINSIRLTPIASPSPTTASMTLTPAPSPTSANIKLLAQAQSQQDFINAFLAYAKGQYQLWGVPVSVELAQGAFESGWATTRSYNSFFDITNDWHNPPSQVVNSPYTTIANYWSGAGHWFRSYDTAERAWLDYGYFLKYDPNYTSAWNDIGNPRQFLIDEFCIYTYGPNGYCDPNGGRATILSIYDNYTSVYGSDGNGGGGGGTDGASFVTDVTIPDGTTISSGQTFTKTWRIRNTGTTTWGSGYTLTFTSGAQMNAPATVNVSSTLPNNTADISVNMTAPGSSGTYIGYWKMKNPHGQLFGDSIWVKITVSGSSSSCPNLSGQVNLYNQTNCGGNSTVANGPGYWDMSSSFNDAAQSIAIPKGWSARLFKHNSWTSPNVCIPSTVGDLHSYNYSDGTTAWKSATYMIVYNQSNCPDSFTDDATFVSQSGYPTVVSESVFPDLFYS